MIQVIQEFSDWNMGVSENLVQCDARVLDKEQIVQGAKGANYMKYDSGQNADWTAQLRCKGTSHLNKTIYHSILSFFNQTSSAKNFCRNRM